MKWDESHESPDVIDERGQGPTRRANAGGGLMFLLPLLLRTRYGWVVLLIGAVFWLGRGVLGGAGGRTLAPADRPGQHAIGAPETPDTHFVAFVLDDVQTAWAQMFAKDGRPYRHARLVLYTDAAQTGCGFGDAATGPFYCPSDERVYIDLGFFDELSGKLGAGGQFARAYVVAHEIGHHIQKLLGTSQKVEAMRSTRGATGASVRLELQADCFAGIWAHSTQQRSILEAGDIDSALGAAAAVGDDRLQRMARGTVSPESWTHGSSAERVQWFRKGYDSGTVGACDTFSATNL
jgi:uncharacterized protein